MLALDAQAILENVKKVQKRNGIAAGAVESDMDFSVEMETGTGKDAARRIQPGLGYSNCENKRWREGI